MKKLRFKGKSKKLNSRNKYQYYVITNDEILKYINNVKIYELKNTQDNNYSFYCNLNSLKKLKTTNVSLTITNRYQNWFINRIFKKIISIIGLLLILFVFVLNNFFIRTISFVDEYTENDNVYNYIIDNTKKIGPYYLLNDTVSSISKKLRTTFHQYAYIGIRKRGTKLLIDINTQDVPIEKIDNEPLYGEYISNYNGKIEYINCKSGVVLVKPGDVVTKNQLLITSNLMYEYNLYNQEKLCPLDGYIIANINEYVEIRIPKKEKISIYTDKVLEQRSFKIFDKEFSNNKSIPYNMFYIKKYEVFNALNFFRIYKSYIYEKEEIVINRNLNDSKKEAHYKIMNKFNQEKQYKEEKIVSITLLKQEENKEEYVFTFYINYYKNICNFKKYV